MIHPIDTVKAKVILNNVNYNQLQLEDFSVFLEGQVYTTITNGPMKSAEGKTTFKSSLSRQVCHQVQIKGSRPPILYEKCVRKCLLRPIHNFIDSHTDHLSKHLSGILGPSHIVVSFNPPCSHFLLCSQLHTYYSILIRVLYFVAELSPHQSK
jgi:hypothetical protein